MMRKVWVMCALLMSLLLLQSAALAQDWLPRVPESPDATPAQSPPHNRPDPRNPSAGQPHIRIAKPPQLRAIHPSKVAATKAPEKLPFRRIWGSDDAPSL